MDLGWWFFGAGVLLVVAALVIRSVKRRYYGTWNRCVGRVVALDSRQQMGETGPVTVHRSTVEFENARQAQVRFNGPWGCPPKFAKVGATVPVVYLGPLGGDARIEDVGMGWEKSLVVLGACQMTFGLLLLVFG